MCRVDRLTNEHIRITCDEQPEIIEIIRTQRLRWLGHMMRMSDNRMPKKIFFGKIISSGQRRRGRPRRTWSDVIRCDMIAKNIYAGGRWYPKCQDRPLWRKLIY